MLVKSYAAAVQGIDAIIVTVETVVNRGLSFCIVGLPDKAVQESHERVKAAINQSGYSYPRLNIVINLAPADVRKEGAAYDLPIAVSVLVGAEIIKAPSLSDYVIMGELSLDGSLMPVKGVLPMAIEARAKGFKGIIVPEANATEAAVVNRLEVYGMKNLRDVVDFLRGAETFEPTQVNTRAEFAAASQHFDYDFSEVKGQENVK
ncbi:MAG: magnesium chelatase, partial [Muribaculaceae bacterium]|nr:magnesium chelatase [Muribaculaceae bacterium]